MTNLSNSFFYRNAVPIFFAILAAKLVLWSFRHSAEVHTWLDQATIALAR